MQEYLFRAENRFNSFFNLTMTYRLDSDLVCPYGWFSPKRALHHNAKVKDSNDEKIIHIFSESWTTLAEPNSAKSRASSCSQRVEETQISCLDRFQLRHSFRQRRFCQRTQKAHTGIFSSLTPLFLWHISFLFSEQLTSSFWPPQGGCFRKVWRSRVWACKRRSQQRGVRRHDWRELQVLPCFRKLTLHWLRHWEVLSYTLKVNRFT